MATKTVETTELKKTLTKMKEELKGLTDAYSRGYRDALTDAIKRIREAEKS